MIHEVILQQIGVNDKLARIIEWHVSTGDRVHSSDILCTVETSKSIVDIKTDKDGYVHTVAPQASDVAVNGLLCLIGSNPDLDFFGYLRNREEKDGGPGGPAGQAPSKQSLPEGVQITRKARVLAEQLGLKLEELPKQRGMIREKDVQRFFEQMDGRNS